jgi:hypothetical protein
LNQDPILWWVARKNAYPNLWRMALDLLGIPATSTPSERLFSRAGEIFTSCRKCLHGDTAQALLNIGTWWTGRGLPGIEAPTAIPDLDPSEKQNIHLPLVLETEDGDWRFDERQKVDLINEVLDTVGDSYEVPNMEGVKMDKGYELLEVQDIQDEVEIEDEVEIGDKKKNEYKEKNRDGGGEDGSESEYEEESVDDDESED